MSASLEDVPPKQQDDLRGALAALVREGVDLSVRRLRDRAGGKTQHAQLVLAAYRAGRFPLELPPPAPVRPAASDSDRPDDPAEVPLDELVAGVDTHERHVQACQRITREIAAGRLEPRRGKVLLEALCEMRQGIKGAAQEGVEEAEELQPCTVEAAELVAVFEAIVSDDRRSRLVALARAELAADEGAGPSALGKSADSEGQ